VLNTRRIAFVRLELADGGIVYSWEEQNAKRHFMWLLEQTLKYGPQVITRNGTPLVVLVSIDEWKRLQRAARPGLKELLMTPAGQTRGVPTVRRRMRRRLTTDL
jgi:antitoxin Phd